MGFFFFRKYFFKNNLFSKKKNVNVKINRAYVKYTSSFFFFFLRKHVKYTFIFLKNTLDSKNEQDRY